MPNHVFLVFRLRARLSALPPFFLRFSIPGKSQALTALAQIYKNAPFSRSISSSWLSDIRRACPRFPLRNLQRALCPRPLASTPLELADLAKTRMCYPTCSSTLSQPCNSGASCGKLTIAPCDECVARGIEVSESS